jgi:hypothetical protein
MKQSIDFKQFNLSGGIEFKPHQDGVLVTFPEEGGRLTLTGSPLGLGGLDWKGAVYLVLDATGLEDFDLALVWHFSTGREANSPFVMFNSGSLPQIRTLISIPLSALDSSKMFIPRTPGRLKEIVLGHGVALEQVIALTITTKKCHKPQSVIFHDVYLTWEEPDYRIDNPPILDKLGQYKLKDWPGKTPDEDSLIQRLQQEYQRYDQELAYKGRSRFGGDLSTKWEGTGFFRTHFDGKRWYLADPDGYRFISTGLDCCRPGENENIEGIECLHDELPDREIFADAYRDFDANVNFPGDTVSFAITNLIKAFGSDWKKHWIALTRNRLVDWYINTIGNWSDPEFIHDAKLPYVWPLEGFPTTQTCIFRDFPDVYSGEYETNSVKFAKQVERFKGDPYMVGYFLRNEPEWAFVQNLLIAEKVLENPADTCCKQVFIQELKDKYVEIDALNQAWGKNFSSFDDLLKPVSNMAAFSEESKNDAYQFSVKMIRRYVTLPSRECRKVDPDHMNLGMRYAMLLDPILLEGYENFDVFSINCYSDDSFESVQQAGEITNKPVIVGEYHFGAIDAGMLCAGISSVMTQKDRGLAYRVYYEKGMNSPYFVGAHYFILNDQPTLGRMDGENMQIGFVDVCHTAYIDFVNEVRDVNESIYQTAEGKRTVPEPVVKRIPRLMGF